MAIAAVPDLIQVLTSHDDRDIVHGAAAAMAKIGPRAVPRLLAAVRQRELRHDGELFEGALAVLKDMGSAALPAVKAASGRAASPACGDRLGVDGSRRGTGGSRVERGAWQPRSRDAVARGRGAGPHRIAGAGDVVGAQTPAE